ncbi:MAG: hypothetical protein J6F30_06095 [Cellulosilyticum sp.]|nr:hypothetical protein [Cellulosilyticum sp.]
MSNPKFLVFKLKDLRIPALILLIVVALFAMLLVKNKTTPTFSPSNEYDDGKYIAGITLSDADMDLVVEVKDNNIVSISLSALTETSSTLYEDLMASVDYINTYVTATQSLELPQNGNTTPATMLLMDAVKVALSDDQNASLSTTYEKVNLPSSEELSSITSTDTVDTTTIESNSMEDNEPFVDEFQEEDFPSVATEPTLENELTIEQ